LSLAGSILGCVLSQKTLNIFRKKASIEADAEADRRIAALKSNIPNITIQPSQEKNNILEITDPRTGAQIRGTINTVMKFFNSQPNMLAQQPQPSSSEKQIEGRISQQNEI
jgi:hypothetical protein